MKLEFRVQSSEFRIQKAFYCLLLTAYCLLTSCSQPVLETPECIASRDVVKRFYSKHFGNDMKPSTENLAKKKDFLSENLLNELKANQDTKTDYFTQTENYPKAFRVGKCETKEANRVRFDVLLFWRTEEKNIQKEISVQAVKEEGEWKIDEIRQIVSKLTPIK